MSLFDRYTILKWQETCRDFTDTFSGRLLRFYTLCNATMLTRLISLGVILGIVLAGAGVASWLGPQSPVPMSKKLVLTATDAQGDKWAMDTLKNQDLQAILNGPVKPGQPLTLTVKFLSDPPNLLIKPDIAGAAGERYFPGILKNGQWQEPPSVVISDRNGKLLHQGQFEYG
jgi:hypothetical protein